MHSRSISSLSFAVLDGVENGRDAWHSMCSVMTQLEQGAKIAVAVSGGSDSLALLWLIKMWSLEKGASLSAVVALSVHHGWRESAQDDLICVQNHAQKWEVPFVSLYGERTTPPASRFQERARAIRYRLMIAWCRGNHVPYLLTAHHRLDQVETFLMRLCRGSGLDGLSSIAQITKHHHHHSNNHDVTSTHQCVRIVRPLLDCDPQTLKELGKKVGIQAQEDPLNDSSKFLRNRIRKIVPILEQEGLSQKRILETVKTLQRTKRYLDALTLKDAKAHLTVGLWGEWRLSYDALYSVEEEGLWRLIRWMMMRMMRHEHPPRGEALSTLCDALVKTQEHDTREIKGIGTLGGCVFLQGTSHCLIVKEMALLPKVPCDTRLPTTWDRHTLIWHKDATPLKGSFLKPIGKNGWSFLKSLRQKKPQASFFAFPCCAVGSRLPCRVNSEGEMISIPEILGIKKAFSTFRVQPHALW